MSCSWNDGNLPIMLHGMKDNNQQRNRVVEAYRRQFGQDPELVVRSPGRVALLGSHVDYSEGWVMPAAISSAVWLAAGARNDRRWQLEAIDLEHRATLDLENLPVPIPEQGREMDWTDLPAGVAWVLREESESKDTVRGMNAVYGGDLPAGAGVSSSAAVEVAFLLGAKGLAGDGAPDRLSTARQAQRVENTFLGLQSGIMDPFAGLFSRRNHLIYLDCRTHEHQLVPLPPGLAVLVVDSGVRRRLATSGFNDRRRQCEQAVAELQKHTSRELSTLRDVDLDFLEQHVHHLPPTLACRARHAVEEMARVRKASRALTGGDVESFGAAMVASHASSRDLYEVSIPELDLLSEVAARDPDCLGAKLMGGGFGGCVAALVREQAVDRVEASMVEAFTAGFGRRPSTLRAQLVDGAEIARFD